MELEKKIALGGGIFLGLVLLFFFFVPLGEDEFTITEMYNRLYQCTTSATFSECQQCCESIQYSTGWNNYGFLSDRCYEECIRLN